MSKNQPTLFLALAAKLRREHGVVRLIETHISCVMIAGEFAYKFKKAVRLAFLDFSTLERRRLYCEEELRLNRRLAPEIYLAVVPVTGTAANPELGGGGDALEYAVKMRAFDQEALWDHRLDHDLLTEAEVDALAQRLAEFHRLSPQAPPQSAWGAATMLADALRDDLSELADVAESEPEKQRVAETGGLLTALGKSLQSAFDERRAHGKIRECHGDLHSGNVITIDNAVTAFDCIEFSEGLRWIDVMNDLAFLRMDLRCRRRGDLAARLLNAYLELGGDYEGLAVLRYYETARALVRAKVAWLRARQLGENTAQAAAGRAQGDAYLDCARRIVGEQRPALMITRGCSGSGKSLFSELAAEAIGAVRIRSDVERKRLFDMAPTDRPDAATTPALYGEQATRATYARLLTLSEQALRAGWPAIVDAAFLKQAQRRPFMELAARLHVPFFIFEMHAAESTMKARIEARQRDGRDASDAGVQVLLDQLAHAEALAEDERSHYIGIDMEAPMEAERARDLCAPVLRLLSA
jgi:aminoglycoside phosphotransferase family enzyme/predicted kinase